MPIPIITVAQMREWEKATWASGQTEEAVIQQAGKAVAAVAARMTKPGDLVVVFAGKGHNGDDARVAADNLAGREVHVLSVSAPEATLKEMRGFIERRPSLIIDGLFGIGLSRPLGGGWMELIESINKSGRPILAVDVPSGLNADTGLPLENAIRATCTITLGALKEGFMQPMSWPFVGRIEVAHEIGLIPYPFTTEISFAQREDFHDFPPPRAVTGHKGSFGHLAVIAGSLGYHGAAVLACRGAQRAMPGLTTLITSPETYVPCASQLQAVMVRPWSDRLELPDNCSAIVVGPGLAGNIPPFIVETVKHLWTTSELPMVVDASALAWLPKAENPPKGIRVVTPHPGEAARILGTTAAEIQSHRAACLRTLSTQLGQSYVVLKGHHTMIGRAKEELHVNCTGNPLLAQGGSGDLLAGYIGGLLAQPGIQNDPLFALRYAVWQHGASADQLSAERYSWSVEDLAACLGTVRP